MHKAPFLAVFWLLAFVCAKPFGFAQGGNLNITTSVPVSLTVCGPATTFSTTVSNTSTNDLTNLTATITMPPGMRYVAGTVTGTGVSEFNISNLQIPVFTLPNLNAGQAVTFTWQAQASCGSIAWVQGNNDIFNTVRVDYTGNYDQVLSDDYNILVPNLVVTVPTNASFSGNIGDTYNRTVRVTNTGQGALAAFTLTDVHGNGTTITNVSLGSRTTSGSGPITETIQLVGSNFTGFGDGDNLLEFGEFVDVVETVRIDECTNLGATFSASWGCFSSVCQTGNNTANTVIANNTPNLVFSTASGNTSNECMGNAHLNTLTITNTGTGSARNVFIGFGIGGYPGFSNNHLNYFDAGSFLATSSMGGSYSLTTTVTGTNTNIVGCWTAAENRPGRLTTTVPLIRPGETITVTFDMITCCRTQCNSTATSRLGWAYQASFDNQCLTNTTNLTAATGRSSQGSGLGFNTTAPFTIANGATDNVAYTFTSNTFSYPRSTSYFTDYKLVITVPSCLTVNPAAITFSRNGGANVWAPHSVTGSGASGSTITLVYRMNQTGNPFNFVGATTNNLNGAILNVPIQATGGGGACAACGNQTVRVSWSFIPRSDCACEMPLSPGTGTTCGSNTTIAYTCPNPCPDGLQYTDFYMKRTTFGLPDNDNNGVPDGSGSINRNLVQLTTSFVGDTMEIVWNGRINLTSGTIPSFSKIFARVVIPEGRQYTLIPTSASVRIMDASAAATYNVNNLPVDMTTGTNRTLTVNASDNVLTGVPPGFVYEHGDSVRVRVLVYQTRNPGNSVTTQTLTTQYFASNLATASLTNYPPSNQQFRCGIDLQQNIRYSGYNFNISGRDVRIMTDCNNVSVQNFNQDFNFQVANSTNLFNHEYRNFSRILTLTANIPVGWSWISAAANASYQQSIFTGGGNNNQTITLNPTSIVPIVNGTTNLVFDMAAFYPPSGTWRIPDEGFSVRLNLRLQPSCRVPNVTDQFVFYRASWDSTYFGNVVGLNHSSTNFFHTRAQSSGSSENDLIQYQRPILTATPLLPTQDGILSTVSWDVQIQNQSSNSRAENTWIILTPQTGITITEVREIGPNTVFTPVGGVYQIGTTNASSTRTFRVTATYNTCAVRTVSFATGWNCGSYPTSLTNYANIPCTATATTLTLNPRLSSLQATFTSSPPSSVDLCQFLDYELTVTNVEPGFSFNNQVRLQLPPFMTYVAGTSEIAYPSSAAFVPVANPTVLGSFITYNAQINTLIGAGGLPGSTSGNNAFKIKFRLKTDCGYTSGSIIRIRAQGNHRCGTAGPLFTASSAPVNITGATVPYTTNISIGITDLNPCAGLGNSTLNVRIVNNGPGSVGADDQVRVTIPQYVSYVPGSYTAVTNGSVNTIPTQTPLGGGETRLEWDLLQGVPPGQAVEFSILLHSDRRVACFTNDITVNTVLNNTFLCVATGNTCGSSIQTGLTAQAVPTIKSGCRQGYWTGNIDTDWFEGENWEDCIVPVCGINVEIPDQSNDPTISSAATASCQDILVRSGAVLTMVANSQLDICGDVNFENGMTFSGHPTSVVRFVGTANQQYTHSGTGNFENVVMQQASAPLYLDLRTSLNMNRSLTLNQGIIRTANNEAFVISGLPASCNQGNLTSYVEGFLRRNVHGAGTGLFYLPVGNAFRGYELAALDFIQATQITQLLTHFRCHDVACSGTTPGPQGGSECGTNYVVPFLDHGFWTIDAFPAGLSNTGRYHMATWNRGFSNPGMAHTIAKRPTGSSGAWQLNGRCNQSSTAAISLRDSMQGFSEFAIAVGDVPFPVEIASFEAVPADQTIDLNWLALTEIGLKNYEVERSIDGVIFQRIGSVPARNLSGAQAYTLTDFNVQPDVTYLYRLKAIDLDGTSRHSVIRSARLTGQTVWKVRAYPNPFKESLTIESTQAPEAEQLAEVYTLTGKLMLQQLLTGNGTFELELRNLPVGIYLLKVRSGEKTTEQKIIKSH